MRAQSVVFPAADSAPVVGETILALVNGLYSDECAGMSTMEIGRVGVEDGVGIEGAMAWAFPSLSSYLVFFFFEA